jgi:hypothetical protein
MARTYPPGAPPARRGFARPRLLFPDPSSFPYRQTVPVARGGVERSQRIVREMLAGQGFALVAASPSDGRTTIAASGSPPQQTVVVAERRVEHDSSDRPILVAFWTLVSAGIALGVVDAILDGYWQIVLPWAAAFSTIAVVFWYAYGRCYRSEVVMVVFDLARGSGAKTDPVAGPTQPHLVSWFAGRVRSEIRTSPEPHSRRPVRIDPSVVMVRVLANLVPKFARNVNAAPGS